MIVYKDFTRPSKLLGLLKGDLDQCVTAINEWRKSNPRTHIRSIETLYEMKIEKDKIKKLPEGFRVWFESVD